jgi:signal peptidase I
VGHIRRGFAWTIGLLVFGFLAPVVMSAFTIPSRSMEPTLLFGDYVLTDNAVYRSRSPRGDLVVHRYPEDIRRGEVLINGRALDEPYIKRKLGSAGPYDACTTAYGCEPIEIPAGRYFVLSDDRDSGQDSRHFGPVRENAIIGRIFSIYWSWDSEAHWLRRERVGKPL